MKCLECGLVQFLTATGIAAPCRRCRVPLIPAPEPVLAVAPPLPGPLTIADSIKGLRSSRKLSQRALAEKMGKPRTYISKVENSKATPTIQSLGRLARALDVSVGELLSQREQQRADAIRELIGDPFVAAILPSLPRLSELQRDGLLVQLRQMAERPRRMA